jgi:membrane protease YdiL (CAAX protease family)
MECGPELLGMNQDVQPEPIEPTFPPIAFAVGYLVLAMVTGRVIVRLGGAGLAKPPLLIWSMIAAQLSTAVVLGLASLERARVVGGGRLSVGLGCGPMTRVPVIVALTALVAVYDALIVFLIYRLAPNVRIAFFTVDRPIWLAFAIVTILASPVVEEMFFRGWLWTGLRSHLGVLPTATITSLLWLAAHLEFGLRYMLLLLPTAAVLAAARHYGGSIAAPIVVHVVSNLVSVGGPVLIRI